MKAPLAALAASLLIAGCSNFGSLNKYQPYPQAQLPEKSYQDKIQAAQHWDILAKNEADLIAESVPSGTIVAISPDAADSSFGKAYRNLLTQHLIANGAVIAGNTGSARYLIDYDAQIVQHHGRDELKAPAGALTAIGASAWLIAHAAEQWGDPGLVAIPFAVAGDMYLANNRDAETPNTEVLMTTKLLSGDFIVQSSTRIYYFNPGDTALYSAQGQASFGGMKRLPVTDQP